GLVVIGVAWLRPNREVTRGWLDLDRLPSWARRWDILSNDDEEEDKTKQTLEAEDDRESLRVVRLKSANLARRFGVETAPVQNEQHAHRLVCNAEAAYAPRRPAEVLSRGAGGLRQVPADLAQVRA